MSNVDTPEVCGHPSLHVCLGVCAFAHECVSK